ncbi:acyl carrier protein [Parabacteroides sp. FAFU027]|uniref:acyl carrier protein n=1 Tax=Parabacteroides sp. FAFU027 TaxID=2922715 RepID=UPI001FB033FA|nr:acyl carrier protein [Parabacteroides sp. FAFU027]
MEIKKFTQKIKEQFIDAEQIEIEEDTFFRNIDSYDSLTGMAILVMIQDDFGLIITEDKFKGLNTPIDLYNYIQANI